MKRILLLFIVLVSSGSIMAQQTPKPTPPPPLPVREVSGVVKDSTDNTVIGATVTLTSTRDTLKTVTNTDGVFVFRAVKEASFYITITSIGFKSITKKMLNNDAVRRLVLDPIILKEETTMLNEVKVDGTPSITFKTDTVEYRAKDYVVRANATVDELLKKMEGMEVANDGTLLHQGVQVTKAKINGKIVSGGDVAATIQNLPADIVDKIQIVDDYGDQAARTGIKDGDPDKILNITTRADRSIGNIARLEVGAGSNDRYNASARMSRSNANQRIEVAGNFNNTILGVTSSGSNSSNSGSRNGGSQQSQNNTGSGLSGGMTRSVTPSFTYRDDWGKKINVNLSYNYRVTNTDALTSSVTTTPGTRGTTVSNRDLISDNDYDSHNFSFEFEYEIDSANFFRFTPSLSYQQGNSGTNSTSSKYAKLLRADLLKRTPGVDYDPADPANYNFDHTNTVSLSNRGNTTPNFGGILFYQHLFEKKGFKRGARNFSIQLSANSSNQGSDVEQDTHIYYLESAPESNVVVKDSLVYQLRTVDNLNSNYRASLTYSEPLSAKSTLQFNGQVNYRGYDNTSITNRIDNAGTYAQIDSLSNIYNYSFTETRLAANYRYQASKYNFSLGFTAVPALLAGTRVNLNVKSRRASFNMIPIARFQYQWSRQQQFHINYSGSFQEPTFDQIQPVRDASSPQNPVVGNPDLKAAFRNTVSAQYNEYMSNSKLTLAGNLSSTFVSNQVSSNTVTISQKIKDATGKEITNTIYERRFLNLNGNYSVNGNYTVSKQLANRKYNLSLNGIVSFGHGVNMSNNILYNTDTWRMYERFGPRINPTEWFEVNPTVSYDISKVNSTLTTAFNNRVTRTLAMNIDGQIDFLKSWVGGYSASKNFISGINTNISTNPLIVNAYLEKQFFKRKNGVLRIQAFDLFNQNNFINRNISEQGATTDTRTNALSRYLMLSFRVNLQKWSGTPSRNGKPMQRRGDGSFINN